jgi:putative sterol carrier protein
MRFGVASTTEVKRKLEELIARLDATDPEVQASLRASVPEPRILSLHLPDLDADYWTELDGDGLRELHEGPRGDADVRITVDSDLLVDVIDGRAQLVSAYLGGKIRIDASFADLLQLRRMLA